VGFELVVVLGGEKVGRLNFGGGLVVVVARGFYSVVDIT